MTLRGPEDLRYPGFLSTDLLLGLKDGGDPELRALSEKTVAFIAAAAAMRESWAKGLGGNPPDTGEAGYRKVYNVENTVFDENAPCRPSDKFLVRIEGGPPSTCIEANDAYKHAGTVRRYLKEELGRNSLNNRGLPITLVVNYVAGIADAMWDGTQVIFLLADRKLFQSFTRSLGITAHELMHGVLQFESGLKYEGQAGTLNEHFGDVMGVSIEQWSNGDDVKSACWVLGHDVLGPLIEDVRGIRSFDAHPAYFNHRNLKNEPQPKHMRDFVRSGHPAKRVHTNVGIPNHAFYLAANALGGNAWDVAAKIWFNAFTEGINPRATFVQAARATHASAGKLYGAAEARAVGQAWEKVGIKLEV